MTFATASLAAAQSSDDTWDQPVNLSHSGTATNPAMVIDSGGMAHAVWQDTVAQYVYARYENGSWSAPQPTSLHLLFGAPAAEQTTGQTEVALHTGPNPLFVAGRDRYSFAVWITAQGALYASRVPNNEIMNEAAWTATRILSASAATFAVTIDARGSLHVAYLRTVDAPGSPAGLYYVRARNEGLDWTLPVRLYDSAYFHALAAGEANLSMAAAGTAEASVLYIAWDNRARKQTFLVKSTDNGVNWEQPMLVAGPELDSGMAGPFNLQVGAQGNKAVLVWQYGEPEANCTQFYQASGDAGVTWSPAQVMLRDVPGCAASQAFVTGPATAPSDWLYLLIDFQSQVILSAWDGAQWSQPQAQPMLAGFEDPEIYAPIDFDCQQAAWYGTRLYVIGCDQRGGDIWVTARDVAATADWFVPPVWGQPAPISDQGLAAAAMALVAPGDNLIHAVVGLQQDASIYYTRWDGTSWSRIAPVLRMPEGQAGWPVVAAGPDHELMLVARNNNGSLYFSRSKSSEAVTASGWSIPARLPIAHDGQVGRADIAWTATGTIYVAYAVPVHQEHGIYLVQSTDQGRTWSEARRVFGGTPASLDLVGPPTLLALSNGGVHVAWTEQAVPMEGGSQPHALYYARSADGGLTFGQAELVVEAPVTWHKVAADDTGTLHRLWQRTDMPATIWDQISVDGGLTWQLPQRLPAEAAAAAVTLDPAGRLHLVGLGAGSLSHWLWEGSRWQAEAPLRLAPAEPAQDTGALLAAAVKTDGNMMAVMALPASTSGLVDQLLYTSRTLDLPPAGEETAVTTPATPATQALSATPTLTPAAASATRAAPPAAEITPTLSPTEAANAESGMSQYLLALLPVGLLLGVVLGIAALRTFLVRPQ